MRSTEPAMLVHWDYTCYSHLDRIYTYYDCMLVNDDDMCNYPQNRTRPRSANC